MAKSNMNLKAFAGVVQSATQRGDQEIPVDLIDINPQVRTQFNPVKQASINASIAAQGINQSLILHAKPDGRYDLIAGEYRIRGAFANELKTVPARVKHNLSAWQIRRVQVSENMEREDITAFDEAMGVAEDVEKYGFEVAQQIWNRSEGWVSKRTAVLKYAEPVRKLLQDGVSNDLEVAHSLNQLHQLDEQEYARLEKSLREGVPLSRDEVRGKVKLVKEWKDEEKQRNDRRKALSNTPAKEKTGPRQAQAAKAGPAPASPARENAATAHPGSGRPTLTTTPATAGAPAPETGEAHDHQVALRTQSDERPRITNEQALVLDQMVTLFPKQRRQLWSDERRPDRAQRDRRRHESDRMGDVEPVSNDRPTGRRGPGRNPSPALPTADDYRAADRETARTLGKAASCSRFKGIRRLDSDAHAGGADAEGLAFLTYTPLRRRFFPRLGLEHEIEAIDSPRLRPPG